MSKIQLTLRQLHSDSPSISSSERCHVLRQVGAMMKKEASVYKCNDYVLSHKLENVKMSRGMKPSDPSQDFVVDDICRQKMCEWSYRIVDHFGGSRELVAISQNYVDRFLDQFRW